MTFIKRFTSLAVSLSLVLSLGLAVFAAGGGTVDTLTANISGNDVSVSGKTTGVAAAVFVEVLDGTSPIAAESFAVKQDGSFSGKLKITGTVPADVTVRAADYEGGAWKTVIPGNTTVVAGYRLKLDGYIGVDYYLKLDPALANEGTSVTFTQESVVDELCEQTVSYSKADKIGENVVFECKVTSAEMTLPIKAVLTNGDTSIEFDDFMVRDYANYLIEHPVDDTTTALASALKSYGYFAQVKFNAGGEKFANDIVPFVALGEDVVAPSEISSIDGVEYYGSSVTFLSGAKIRHYFTVTDNTAEFTVGGQSVDPVGNGTVKYIATSEMSALVIGNPIEVSVSCAGQNTSFSYSALNYVAAVLNSRSTAVNMKNLANAYYTYYRAAVAYDAEH